jgi:hypothetical protein
MRVFLVTSDTRICEKGGECRAETDLGDCDIEEHSRLIDPPHTRCARCARLFEHPEVSLLIIPPDWDCPGSPDSLIRALI